jgi:hypothetical protein
MKPDVLVQIKEIEAEREKMVQEEMARMRREQQENGPIMVQRPGEEPVALTSQEIMKIINDQKSHIENLTKKLETTESLVVNLQKQLLDKTKEVRNLKKNNIVEVKEEFTRIPIQVEDLDTKSKCEPEVNINI